MDISYHYMDDDDYSMDDLDPEELKEQGWTDVGSIQLEWSNAAFIAAEAVAKACSEGATEFMFVERLEDRIFDMYYK